MNALSGLITLGCDFDGSGKGLIFRIVNGGGKVDHMGG